MVTDVKDGESHLAIASKDTTWELVLGTGMICVKTSLSSAEEAYSSLGIGGPTDEDAWTGECLWSPNWYRSVPRAGEGRGAWVCLR